MTSSSGQHDHHDAKMVRLIEELSHEKNVFQTCTALQNEILRRVKHEHYFENEEESEKFEEVQNSVFDRVEQHKLNGEKKLNHFSEQFMRVHKKDHKTYTEDWLYEQTGRKIELDHVLENPTFSDFIGTYKVWPMSAYIASKFTIDETDFMGVFDLGEEKSDAHTTGTYEGLVQRRTRFSAAEYKALENEEQEVERNKHEVIKDNKSHDYDNEWAMSTCCSSNSKPHALGAGEYVQFSVRKENILQYFSNSTTAKKLSKLIEADSPGNPKEQVYAFTVSSNGIMRFHPCGGIQRKLWHAYGDSTSSKNFIKNIGHAGTYGCFCFGVVYKEKENYTDKATGRYRQGGRTIVMRYNRWATDNHPVYAMVRKTHDDRSIPLLAPVRSFWESVLACSACRDKANENPSTIPLSKCAEELEKDATESPHKRAHFHHGHRVPANGTESADSQTASTANGKETADSQTAPEVSTSSPSKSPPGSPDNPSWSEAIKAFVRSPSTSPSKAPTSAPVPPTSPSSAAVSPSPEQSPKSSST